MRTTDRSDSSAPRRAPRAAAAKIVLTGCSTGAALGMVGVMALAEAPVPAAPLVETAPEPATTTLPPTTVTLPPKRVITYVYRRVIVEDAAQGQVQPPRSSPQAAPRAAAAASPAPSAAPASPAPTRPRAAAPTTTTTQAS